MKLRNPHRPPTPVRRGMTLVELTVVILVFLSLISILFVGARAWKRGSDRAGCIMNIRNAPQATRSCQNMNNLAVGTTINMFTEPMGRRRSSSLRAPAQGNTLTR